MAEDMRPRILVVDDDAGIRETLRFLFEDAGYNVEEAADGAAALTLLRSEECQRVMLLDRMMPRLDGVQTLCQLRGEPELIKRTVVLMMTALSNPPSREIAALIRDLTAGIYYKPFDIDALLIAVDRACKQFAEASATMLRDRALPIG